VGNYNRTIFDTLHLIRNVKDNCQERKIPYIALSFNQAKAFDRMNQNYVLEITKAMGFGPVMIQFIKLLYVDIHSTILVNGFLTEIFKVTRSMRQGCGISPLLFATGIEVLINSVRQSLIFRGVPMPHRWKKEIRIAVFADDTTVFATNEESVLEVIRLFET
jgi:hypothetical protein